MDNVINFEKFKKDRNLQNDTMQILEQYGDINKIMQVVFETLLNEDVAAYDALIAMQILINRTAKEIGADLDQIKMDSIYFDLN
tara:strand:+ start:212 stop:463 length:252 start_codon:yes stop_codon:yes gene_type:complete